MDVTRIITHHWKYGIPGKAGVTRTDRVCSICGHRVGILGKTCPGCGGTITGREHHDVWDD